MADQNRPINMPRLIFRIIEILCCGRNKQARIQWCFHAIAAITDLATSFLQVFDVRTRCEIETKLRAANFSAELKPKMATWKPQSDWDTILKLVIELVLQILHDFSPPGPTPPPPGPEPDQDIEKYVYNWVNANIKTPDVKKRARDLAHRIQLTVERITKDPPPFIESARAHMRLDCDLTIPNKELGWHTFSQIMHRYIQDIDEDRKPMTLAKLLDLWTHIAAGLLEVAK